MQNDLHPLLADATQVHASGTGTRFTTGALLPVKSLKFLAINPPLWVWAVLPALINLMIFAVVATLMLFNAGTILEWFWARPEVEIWYQWALLAVWYVVFAVVLVGALVVSYYLVLLISGAVASPFKKKLSEKTEQVLRGTVDDARDGESPFAGVGRAIIVSVAHLLVYVTGLALLLPLYLVPGFGGLAFSALAACWSAVFLAVEYSEDTLDRRGLSLRDKFASLRRDWHLSGGMGAGTAILLAIPVVNLLAMPVAVVAGTVLGLAVRGPE